MRPEDSQRIQAFLQKWQGSQGNERANYQGFFLDLCLALGVDHRPSKGNVLGDPYFSDKDIRVIHKDGITTNFADFYKKGYLLMETKQGGNLSKRETEKRGIKIYDTAMEKSFYQVLIYTPFLPSKPPLLMTCDINLSTELGMSLSGNNANWEKLCCLRGC